MFLSVAALLATASLPARAAGSAPVDAFGRIEAQNGGRLGVFALDTTTGATIGHRADERFALCSTFKWLLAAQMLARVDDGSCDLGEWLPIDRSDLLDYAPFARSRVERGRATVEELARAAVVVSDNTAANLLLRRLGGPATLTVFARSLGDSTTRLDRYEPELNSNAPGDVRDTTTPRGMVDSLRSALTGSALSETSRARLLQWLFDCETGKDRLRAGMPEGWKVGDKTGSGVNGAVNDVAIAIPPGRMPILIASYLSESTATGLQLGAAHAAVAKAVAAELTRVGPR